MMDRMLLDLWVGECPDCGAQLDHEHHAWEALDGTKTGFIVERCPKCPYMYSPLTDLSAEELARLMIGSLEHPLPQEEPAAQIEP